MKSNKDGGTSVLNSVRITDEIYPLSEHGMDLKEQNNIFIKALEEIAVPYREELGPERDNILCKYLIAIAGEALRKVEPETTGQYEKLIEQNNNLLTALKDIFQYDQENTWVGRTAFKAIQKAETSDLHPIFKNITDSIFPHEKTDL